MPQSLTQGPVGPTLTKLTLPMVWGIFALIAFNVADTYFVGQLGTNELAAMSFTFPVVMTLGSLALGLGTGASSIIARAIGEGDRSRVQRFTTNSLTLALVTVGIFVTIGLLTIDPLFTVLGADEETLPLIREYMQIWYFGMICLVVPMVGNSAIRAAGNTLTPSIIMTLSAVINIILDPLLILGIGGFPRMELQGAAIATIGARAVTLVASLLVLRFKEDLLSSKLPDMEETLWCWRDILYVGVPAAATSMITPISIGVITAMLAAFGAASVAAFGVASRIESFAMIALVALSVSIGPFVGQNWGAKAYGRVRKALQLSVFFCMGWGILLAILLAVSRQSLARLFNADPEVVAIASAYLLIVPASYGAAGIVQVSSSTFNALGRPIPAVLMTVGRMVGLYIPLAFLGGRFFGVTGIFIAACLSNLIAGLGAYLWNQRACGLKATGETHTPESPMEA
ncbi:MAG: MATE family efflux transporter [Merismopedia sp. SIO2A8]|nr:MATE family efflux transporter [Symploca sp. SIO2B6]NET51560.1 MATE family efflux transporter [Merismopedia sp. SIO2A8]